MGGSRSRGAVHAGAFVLARSKLSLAIAVLLVATAGPTSTRAAEPPTRTRLTNAGSPARITNDGIAYDPTPIVATSGRDALIAYDDGDGNLSILRTADAGATWRGPTSLSARSSYVWRAAALAAFGRHVEIVWAEGDYATCYDDQQCHVVARSSEDGGRTWGPTRRLSRDMQAQEINPAVAVGPAGQVTVVWGSSRLVARTSDDYGHSFGAAVVLARDVASAADLAIAGGVTYVGYDDADGRITVSRSIDHGRTWVRPRPLGPAYDYTHPTIIARGSRVFVSYDAVLNEDDQVPSIVASADRGTTWRPPVAVPPGILGYQHGTWTLLACDYATDEDDCAVTLASRRSDRRPWSRPLVVSAPSDHQPGPNVEYFDHEPIGVTDVGQYRLVLYAVTTNYSFPNGDAYGLVDLFVRRIRL